MVAVMTMMTMSILTIVIISITVVVVIIIILIMTMNTMMTSLVFLSCQIHHSISTNLKLGLETSFAQKAKTSCVQKES